MCICSSTFENSVHPLICANLGALARETKRRVFQIPGEMQRSLDLLGLDYMKERNKLERDHSLWLAPQCNKKKMGLA